MTEKKENVKRYTWKVEFSDGCGIRWDGGSQSAAATEIDNPEIATNSTNPDQKRTLTKHQGWTRPRPH